MKVPNPPAPPFPCRSRTRLAPAGPTLLLVALLIIPRAVRAQPATPGSVMTSAHARAGASDTIVRLDDARLFVPAGAVRRGDVVGLGRGGVPAAEGSTIADGVVVSAAGGLRRPVAIVLALPATARARLGAASAVLLDTASGAAELCLPSGGWLACRVIRPGAYRVVVGRGRPTDEAFLSRAVDAATVEPARGRSALRLALTVGAAALAGAGAAWAAGGRPNDQAR